MMNVLPVFLDHVLHPTLESNAFTTEVHHLDSSAKHNGVVFNEMKGRENSEQDLMDINIRRLLFSGLTTYSFESGGQTPDISILSNQECIDFHKELYNHDNLTIILMGANLNAAKIFEAIESQLHDSKKSIKPDFINPPKLEAVSKKLKFPSSDIETGSIGYGWRGPSDIETRTALEVFMLFLTDTTSSPFNQTFVEIQDPIASDVDVDFKSFYLPCFVVYFSGGIFN